jgi:hypothetical protein
MRAICSFLVALFLAWSSWAQSEVAIIPDAQQAALALKILDAYHGKHPNSAKPLQVVYFTPSDREPEPHYRERLQAILEDIQSFYREGMVHAGFGPETFGLERDTDGKMIIHLVKGKEPEAAFKRSGGAQDNADDDWSRRTIAAECDPVLKADGIDADRETVVIFCNLATWDAAAKKFSHHSPYCGFATQTSGCCFAVDSVILNVDDLKQLKPILHDQEWGDESMGKFNTVFIGGIAHELGHAFSLPHCGDRRDKQPSGVSLMDNGNHMYREELRGEGPGAVLLMASAMKLAGRPLFNKSDKEVSLPPTLAKDELQISTNLTRADLAGHPNALRLEGVVQGTPPIYGVIAYFDSTRSGGYDAPTATTVPDANGRFAMEISDLAVTSKGQLRLQYCHANGAVSEQELSFKASDHGLDLEPAQIKIALRPLILGLQNEDGLAVRTELQKVEASHAPELAKAIAQKLAATLNGEPQITPAETPTNVTELPLGDAKATSARVGWLKPSANRIPANSEITSPLLDCGQYYATGLFAHAPSRYVYDLGGKWKTLRGTAGLHTDQQPWGSVGFSIKADGKELFHSPTIRGASQAAYDVDVTNVKTLELIVDDGGDGNGNDWGLWLDPTLTR